VVINEIQIVIIHQKISYLKYVEVRAGKLRLGKKTKF